MGAVVISVFFWSTYIIDECFFPKCVVFNVQHAFKGEFTTIKTQRRRIAMDSVRKWAKLPKKHINIQLEHFKTTKQIWLEFHDEFERNCGRMVTEPFGLNPFNSLFYLKKTKFFTVHSFLCEIRLFNYKNNKSCIKLNRPNLRSKKSI